jgi:hypothetical protein
MNQLLAGLSVLILSSASLVYLIAFGSKNIKVILTALCLAGILFGIVILAAKVYQFAFVPFIF